MARLSWKSEMARWGIQLLFAIFSMPVFFGETYIVGYWAGSGNDGMSQILWPHQFLGSSCGFLCSFVVTLMISFGWYYIASTYAHYRFDRKLSFDYQIYKSFRMYFFAFQLSLFLFFWELDGGLYQFVVAMFGGPLISITFTWWLSELYCRYKAWKKLNSTQSTNATGKP